MGNSCYSGNFDEPCECGHSCETSYSDDSGESSDSSESCYVGESGDLINKVILVILMNLVGNGKSDDSGDSFYCDSGISEESGAFID